MSRAVAPSYPNNSLQGFRSPISAAVYMVATLEGATGERIGVVVNSEINQEKAKDAVEDLTARGLVATVIAGNKEVLSGNIEQYTVASIRDFQNEWHVYCVELRVVFGSGDRGQAFHRLRVAQTLTGEWVVADWTLEGTS